MVKSHEKLNRLEERAAIHLHDQLDGVEVSLAAKAPGEIGGWIGCGVELSAQRTRETQKALAILRGQAQGMFNQSVHRYLVSQIPELFFGNRSHSGFALRGRAAVRVSFCFSARSRASFRR